MSTIVLLDTTVYLNILDVPDLNQDRTDVLCEFEKKIKSADIFLLPFPVILETGNHIARLTDGQRRRTYAEKMIGNVKKALDGETPYRPSSFPERDQFVTWLDDFPDWAMSNGSSLTDLSIRNEWKNTCDKHPFSRVQIWSLDAHLSSYDRPPNSSP